VATNLTTDIFNLSGKLKCGYGDFQFVAMKLNKTDMQHNAVLAYEKMEQTFS